MIQRLIFPTELGWIGLNYSDRGVSALSFGWASGEEAAGRMGEATCEDPDESWVEEARRMLVAYAAGEPVDLARIPLDIREGTLFQQRVRRQVRKLVYGQTASYGEIAQLAGAPGAARGVGTVMSTNPVPLLIPCHRVLASGGRLGGYSAPQGLEMKQRLLDMERCGCLTASPY